MDLMPASSAQNIGQYRVALFGSVRIEAEPAEVATGPRLSYPSAMMALPLGRKYWAGNWRIVAT
jgi:hypothetical protein